MAKVCLGAGMGLHYAGHVANLSFAHSVEEVILTQRALSQHAVILYKRYFDDCLMVAANHDDCNLCQASPLVHRLKENCAHFTVGDIVVDSKSIKFLDLQLRFSHNRIVVSAALDKIPIPLDSSSYHAPSVHGSWPCSMVKRVHRLSGGDDGQVLKLINIYRRANASKTTLHLMKRAHEKVRLPKKANSFTKPGIWLKARFHTTKHHALNRALHFLPTPHHVPQVRFAWSSANHNIGTLVNMHNKRAAQASSG